MTVIRHTVAGLLIMSILIALNVNIYNEFSDSYSLEKTDIKTIDGKTGNIMEHLQNMTIIKGISDMDTAIQEMETRPAGPLAALDIIATVGLGVLKTIGGILILPYDIVNIVLTFYFGQIPGVIGGLVGLIVVYFGFILLSAFLKKDV